MVTSIYDIDPSSANTHTQGDPFPQFTAYRYDQLHRIKHMRSFHDINTTTNQWNVVNSGTNDLSYKSDFTYDKNGNIKTHNRNGADFLTGFGLPMDGLTYLTDDASATIPTNHLVAVGESVTSAYTTDIKASSGSGNDYDYDGIGNLIKDNKEFIQEIDWTIDRKVKRVTRDATAMIAAGKNMPDLEFEYDANRQRVCKIVKPHDTSGNLKTQVDWLYTYYLRDASGNITATYTKTYAAASGSTNTYLESLSLQEHDIYGSARLGTLNENLAMGSRTFTATLSGGAFTNIGYPIGPVDPFTPCVIYYTDASTGLDVALSCPTSYTRSLGNKRYELSNHLGNVLTVLSDRKLQTAGPASNIVYERIFDDGNLVGVNLDPNIPATGGIVNNELKVAPQGSYSGVGFNFPTTPGQTYQVEFDLDVSQGNTTASDNLQIWIFDNAFNTLNQYPLGAVQNGHYTFTFVGDPTATDMWVKPLYLSGQNTPQNTSTPHFNHYFYIDNFRVTTQNCRKCQDIKTVYDNFVSTSGTLSNANMSSFTTYANTQLGLAKSQSDYTQVLKTCKLMMSVLNFNGSNTSVVSANPANFNLGTGDASIEAWVNLSSTSGYRTIFDNITYTSSQARGLGLFVYNGYLYFGAFEGDAAGAAQIRTSSTLSTGQWTHITALKTGFNPASYSIYINGSPASVVNITSPAPVGTSGMTNTGTLRIGANGISGSSLADYMAGYIRNVKLYNRALGSTEILADYNGGCILTEPGSTSSLVYYGKLDEGSGTTINDYSGNNLGATISNGSWDFVPLPGTACLTTADLQQGLCDFNGSSNLTAVASYQAEILETHDYYPFGYDMPGRSVGADYKYGFNGQMNDDEIYGAGNLTSAEYWEYDTRLGRRWNLDPVPVPGTSDYACFNNNPIVNVDPNGDIVKVHGNVFQKIRFWTVYAFSGKNSQFRKNVDFQRKNEINGVEQVYHYRFEKGHINSLLDASNSMVNADSKPFSGSGNQNSWSSHFGSDIKESHSDGGVEEQNGTGTVAVQEWNSKHTYSRGKIRLKFSSNDDTGDSKSGGDVVTITQGNNIILPPTVMPFGQGITVDRVITFNNININRRAIKIKITNQDGGSPGAFYLKVKISGRR